MKQLHPSSVWLFFFNFIFQSFFALFIVSFSLVTFFASSNDQAGIILDLIGVILVLLIIDLVISFIWAKLSYGFYKYDLTDHGFKKESGVIYKKYVTIPYDRIQNVDINRGIIARLLGLSDLHIQTAGSSSSLSRYGVWGAGAEGKLPGLTKEDAVRVQEELLVRIKQSKNQGL
jgi:uncharacterized membrane protein YdbT with pleckstrin-like domain